MNRRQPIRPAVLQAGRLEQTCPACGIREAAGYYCTACKRPTGPDDWYHKTASPARRAALAKGRAARSLNSQAKRAVGLEQSAGPGPLA